MNAACRIAVLLSLGFSLAMVTSARAQSEDKAVEAGREALRRSGRYPWYDAEKDELRDINAKTKTGDDSETRKKGWQAEEAKAQPTKAPTGSFTGWAWIGQVVQVLAMVALAAMLIALVFYLVRYFLKEDEISLSKTEISFQESRTDVDRVEQLPFQVRKPTSDLLSEARRLYEASRYSEAIIYFYSHLLVELDKHQQIRLAKGKTNRQYLREVRNQPVPYGILGETIIVFEDAFFGHYSLSRERFEEVWNRLNEFEAALDPVGVPA
jgi:hypothetical protein